MPNKLVGESSPYLLQHKDNPVNWYPWGPEALERARREDKPIFLSIGYSACHWCHVMEHESFEDADIAALLNEHFISIKVDREERPELDQIYMQAVQAISGRGGWPMSVFLTPDGEPFYGGTYWPPTARMGMPGFAQVLEAVVEAWENRRERALETAKELTRRVQAVAALRMEPEELSRELIEHAVSGLERAFDSRYGGFGGAPKFPHPMDLQLLLRCWRREPQRVVLPMVCQTFDRMAAGGIYDHLGGGFARYSVDARWLVPHFEKMLYDNALLGAAYLEGYLATGNSSYARVVRKTLDYVLRDMTDPVGPFYSTEDADSEGEEGKFYLWRPEELAAVLGPEKAETFAYVYDVTAEGNFEHNNILHLPKTIEQCAKILKRDEAELAGELAESRAKLLAAREQRVRPGRDDKVLTSWNGLMIDTLARAGAALDEPRYTQAAERAAEFVLNQLRRDDGRLLHTWRHGTAKLDAYLDDYAATIAALVSLYEATFIERHIDEAVRLADLMLELFRDEDGGGFFYTAFDHEPLIARFKDWQDSSVPSGNALAATALLRLGKLCGNAAYLNAAETTLRSAAGLMRAAPSAAGQMLIALDLYLGPSYEIAIIADSASPEGSSAEGSHVVRELRRRFLPHTVVAMRGPSAGADCSLALDLLFEGKTLQPPGPTVYICQDGTCRAPISGTQDFLAAWEQLAPAHLPT